MSHSHSQAGGAGVGVGGGTGADPCADHRARTPEAHQQAVRELIGPRPTIWLPPMQAIGRRLTQAVESPVDSPRFDNSQMDGYALATHHLAGGTFPVGPTIAAGADPDQVYPQGIGEALAPVMTGAKIPQGTAAIIPVERCTPPHFYDTDTDTETASSGGASSGGASLVTVPPTEAGQFIRRQGSDLRAGEVLFPAGHRVNPRTIGAAALQSVHTLPVQQPARVIICTGGDEVQHPEPEEQAEQAGQTSSADCVATIPDANGPMLAALCQQHHIDVAAHVRTVDDPPALRRALEDAVRRHRPTAIITSGGISHGRFEVVRQVLEPTGGWFGHVAQQPGGPQGLGRILGTPVICLPGNPVSTAVSFRLFVAPTLGEAEPSAVAIAAEDFVGMPGRQCFLRGRVNTDHGTLIARAVGGAGSHLLAQSVGANALLAIPAGATIREGEKLTFYSL